MSHPTGPPLQGAPIRLAVIGLGKIWRHHAEALRLLPQFTLAAAADTKKPRSIVIPQGIPFFADHRGILSLNTIDAILVSTPLKSHFEITADALSRGIPILLEKPATESLDDLHALYRIASANGALLVVAYHFAFAPDVQWTREYLASDEASSLGPLTAVWAGFFDPYGSEEDVSSRFESLGGSWMDSGVNALSVLATFADLSKFTVSSSTLTTLPAFPYDARALVALDAPAVNVQPAIHVVIETNWMLGVNHKATILVFDATRTYLHLNHSEQRVAVFQSGRCRRREDCGAGRDRLTNHYVGVFEDFAVRIRTRRDNKSSSIAIHRLLFDASRSAITGSPDSDL